MRPIQRRDDADDGHVQDVAAGWRDDGRRSTTGRRQDVALILHGLVRTRFSMRPLERALQRADFATRNESYPSRSTDVQSLARWLAPRFDECQRRFARVHLLGHSLGCIVGRALLRVHPIANPSSFVMLGPPNQGSVLANRLFDQPLLRWFYGPAGQDLRDAAVVDAICAIPRCPTLIIAGTRSFDLRNPTSYLGRRLLEPPHDGTVRVEETRLAPRDESHDGHRDAATRHADLGGTPTHVEIDETHTFLPSNARAIDLAVSFVSRQRQQAAAVVLERPG